MSAQQVEWQKGRIPSNRHSVHRLLKIGEALVKCDANWSTSSETWQWAFENKELDQWQRRAHTNPMIPPYKPPSFSTAIVESNTTTPPKTLNPPMTSHSDIYRCTKTNWKEIPGKPSFTTLSQVLLLPLINSFFTNKNAFPTIFVIPLGYWWNTSAIINTLLLRPTPIQALQAQCSAQACLTLSYLNKNRNKNGKEEV